MTDFQLDTSGVVYLPLSPGSDNAECVTFKALNDFQRGYTAEIIIGLNKSRGYMPGDGLTGARELGFSDLAPETVQTIIRDCERFIGLQRPSYRNSSSLGAQLWSERQHGAWKRHSFPPLTPTLGDDGLIYFKEADQ